MWKKYPSVSTMLKRFQKKFHISRPSFKDHHHRPIRNYCTSDKFDTMIFHSRSTFNNEVCVFKNQQNHRRLVFNSKKPKLIQGEVKFLPNGKVDCLYIPLRYAQTMLKMTTFFVDKVLKNNLDARMLIAGLGTGTLPNFIHHRYNNSYNEGNRHLLATSIRPKKMYIDIVEIDEMVIHACQNYMGFELYDEMRLFKDDILNYLSTCDETYDIVLVDAYDDNGIPKHLASEEFLRKLHRSLKYNGASAVITNFSSIDIKSFNNLVKLYEKSFEHVLLFDVKGDTTSQLIAINSRDESTLEELVKFQNDHHHNMYTNNS